MASHKSMNLALPDEKCINHIHQVSAGEIRYKSMSNVLEFNPESPENRIIDERAAGGIK
jgi:hypothetical protein